MIDSSGTAAGVTLNRALDRALAVATELEASLALVHGLLRRPPGHSVREAGYDEPPTVDGTLFRVRLQARAVEDALREGLTVRETLVGTYGPALDTARVLVDALQRVYPLALDADAERGSGYLRNIDHAHACAQVFITALELATDGAAARSWPWYRRAEQL